MPFKIGSISGENIKIGNQQIAKVMLGLTKIWENWVAWSHSIGGDSGQGGFVPGYSQTYTVPSNVQVSSISCTAGVYSHSGTAIVWAQISINGNAVANSRNGTAEEGHWKYMSCSYTPSQPLTGGTVITVSSLGTSYRRSVSGSFTGLIKGA